MKSMKSLLFAVALAVGFSTQVSAGPTAIVVVVNNANPLSSMNKAQLSALYKGRTKEFPNGNSAAAVNLPTGDSIRQDFDKTILNFSSDEAKRYWIDMKIRSGAAAPPTVPSPAAVARYVGKNANGIGYLPESDAKRLKIVARIVGGSFQSGPFQHRSGR